MSRLMVNKRSLMIFSKEKYSFALNQTLLESNMFVFFNIIPAVINAFLPVV